MSSLASVFWDEEEFAESRGKMRENVMSVNADALGLLWAKVLLRYIDDDDKML